MTVDGFGAAMLVAPATQDNRIGFKEVEAFDHALGCGFVFLKVRGSEVCFTGSHVGVCFADCDLRRLVLERCGVGGEHSGLDFKLCESHDAILRLLRMGMPIPAYESE